MTIEHSGRGDPTRSMELLWGTREPSSRGPKPGLSIDQIVQAAMAVADRDGLEALSMRRVADALGAGTMSLYRYVPGKAELLDLMIDTAYGKIERSGEPSDGWRERLERIAHEERALHLRHPWLLQVAMGRPTLGPNIIAKYDHELRAVSGIGLTDIEMDAVVTLLTGFVHSVARSAIEAARAPEDTGMTDQQWWDAHAPLLEKVLDPNRYPTAARVGAAAGAAHNAAHNPEHAFEFGLQRVLDGIETLLRSRADGA